jgi:hypothetical protein
MYPKGKMNFSIVASKWLYRISTGRITLAGLFVFLLFISFVLPTQANDTGRTNQDSGSPDMSFYYTTSELYKMAANYGEEGRAAYIRARFTFDLIWPLVYMGFLCTSISWIFKQISLQDSRWGILNITPLLGMIFDYFENISTSIVMYRYPMPTDVFAGIAPFMTAVKWLFVSGSFVILSIGVIIYIWQFIRKH